MTLYSIEIIGTLLRERLQEGLDSDPALGFSLLVLSGVIAMLEVRAWQADKAQISIRGLDSAGSSGALKRSSRFFVVCDRTF
jgi:hypothetical protein